MPTDELNYHEILPEHKTILTFPCNNTTFIEIPLWEELSGESDEIFNHLNNEEEIDY